MPVSRLFHGLAALALISLSACGADAPGATQKQLHPVSKAKVLPGRIVFSREVNGTYQLFTIAPDGSGQRQITHAAGAAVQADWSPDGRKIVFEYDRPNENGCAVRIVNADGAGLKDLS